MDEDSDLAAGHDDVGAARQIAPMQPEPVARGEQQPADKKLGLRVLSFDTGHHPAAIGGRNDINHGFVLTVSLAA